MLNPGVEEIFTSTALKLIKSSSSFDENLEIIRLNDNIGHFRLFGQKSKAVLNSFLASQQISPQIFEFLDDYSIGKMHSVTLDFRNYSNFGNTNLDSCENESKCNGKYDKDDVFSYWYNQKIRKEFDLVQKSKTSSNFVIKKLY